MSPEAEGFVPELVDGVLAGCWMTSLTRDARTSSVLNLGRLKGLKIIRTVKTVPMVEMLPNTVHVRRPLGRTRVGANEGSGSSAKLGRSGR